MEFARNADTRTKMRCDFNELNEDIDLIYFLYIDNMLGEVSSGLPQQVEDLLHGTFAHRRGDPIGGRRVWIFRCAQVSS